MNAKQSRQKVYNRRYRDKVRKVIEDHLAAHPCVDCGNHDTRILEFDHVNGEGSRKNAISRSRGKTVLRAGMDGGIPELLEEIAKCEVRCPNCHKIRHWFERKGLGYHR